MKFQVLSDIHLEFSGVKEVLPEIPVLSPLLCLLGDIGYPSSDRYEEFLLLQADRFERVVVVAGNHEYYKEESIAFANERIAAICDSRENLFFLECGVLEVPSENVRILGAALWTEIKEEEQKDIEFACNDYRMIRIDFDMEHEKVADFYDVKDSELEGWPPTRELYAADTTRIHRESMAWLEAELAATRDAGMQAIVLTHHAPTDRNALVSWERDESDEDARKMYPMTFTEQPEEWWQEWSETILVWAFGHTHFSSDQIFRGVRLVSNQFGYIMSSSLDPTNPFDAAYVIDTEEDHADVVARAHGIYDGATTTD